MANGPTLVPDLSVACVKDEQQLDRIAEDFLQAFQGRLPINAIAGQVALMEKSQVIGSSGRRSAYKVSNNEHGRLVRGLPFLTQKDPWEPHQPARLAATQLDVFGVDVFKATY